MEFKIDYRQETKNTDRSREELQSTSLQLDPIKNCIINMCIPRTIRMVSTNLLRVNLIAETSRRSDKHEEMCAINHTTPWRIRTLVIIS